VTAIALLDDYQHVARDAVDWSRLGPEIDVEVFHEHLDDEALVAALQRFEIVVAMRERSAFPATVLAALPKLRLLATTAMANAAIDLDAARELGIVVSGTRSGITSTVEITWALILAVVKALPASDATLRAGRWQEALPGDLSGATLGLVGLGRIGSAMVPIARAFGMEPIAWSENLTSARAAEIGAKAVSKDELLTRADVVSIHLRLSERTTGLLGARELATMRPTAYLINTSRGPIVDEDALVEALVRRTIAGAGLDVYDHEPLPAGHRLTMLDNVVLTPHLGYASRSQLRDYYREVLENIAAFLAGTPRRVLNPPPRKGEGATS
jgi:phosphoglycerate dehydrogenase-like enzyme